MIVLPTEECEFLGGFLNRYGLWTCLELSEYSNGMVNVILIFPLPFGYAKSQSPECLCSSWSSLHSLISILYVPQSFQINFGKRMMPIPYSDIMSQSSVQLFMMNCSRLYRSLWVWLPKITIRSLSRASVCWSLTAFLVICMKKLTSILWSGLIFPISTKISIKLSQQYFMANSQILYKLRQNLFLSPARMIFSVIEALVLKFSVAYLLRQWTDRISRMNCISSFR